MGVCSVWKGELWGAASDELHVRDCPKSDVIAMRHGECPSSRALANPLAAGCWLLSWACRAPGGVCGICGRMDVRSNL